VICVPSLSTKKEEKIMSEAEATERARKAEEEKKKKEEEEKKKKPEETPAEKLVRIARLYFLVGFAFLPWLWFANALMLFQYRNRPHVPPEVLYYRNWSAICFAVFSVLFVIYIIIIRTAAVDGIPWVIKPGLDYRQDGLWSTANLVNQ
jgi:hypothetical protein